MSSSLNEKQPPPRSRNRTLVDLWDDFYKDDEVNAHEWIVPCDNSLFRQLEQHITHSQSPAKECNILEVGCGTSTLARDFYLYLTRPPPQPQQQSSSSSSLASSSSFSNVSMTATDVSAYAIEHNQRRDAQYLLSSSLHYQVWNVASSEPPPPFGTLSRRRRFHVVLDKGCFDTILFRSDKRHVPSLACIFLNHIHRILEDRGVYLMITPRRKHPWIHSFQGFASVERIQLQSGTAGGEIYKAEKNTRAFLYVCQRQNAYHSQSTESTLIDTAFVGHQTTKNSLTICPSCKMNKTDFVFQGNNRLREWNGHCRHCKATDERKGR